MSKEQEALKWLEDNLKGIASYDGWFREFHKNIGILEQALKDLDLYNKALDKAIEMFIKNNENKCPIAEKDCEETEWEYKGKKHNCNECLKDYLLKESGK